VALRLGAHESVCGGLETAIDRAVRTSCDALQIWTANGRQWAAPNLSVDQVAAFRRACDTSGISPVVAHASYLINIASSNADLFERSIEALKGEVERCEMLGIPYLVLHPGSHAGAGAEVGSSQITRALTEVHRVTRGYGVRILLETTAGQGHTMGAEFESLARMLEGTSESYRLGVCLDTCHVFAAGYDLRTSEAYEATMQSFIHAIGLERLEALHLNDSRHGLGERKDRHEHIGRGKIGLEGFAYILNDPRLAGLPGTLETPKSADLHEDIENLRALRSLVRT